MPDQNAFAIPCNLIISADSREDAAQAALVILRETLGSKVFDVESGMDTTCIGFDHDEETEALYRV